MYFYGTARATRHCRFNKDIYKTVYRTDITAKRSAIIRRLCAGKSTTLS